MLTAEEFAELRMLQARAYRQDGDLSAAQVERLRELERRREPAVAGEEVGARQVGVWATDAGALDADTGPSGAGQSDVVPSGAGPNGDPVDAPAPQRAHPHPHIRPWHAVLAVIVVFALGVGAGWVLFGRADSSSIGLTQEQRLRAEQLVDDGEYDANSLRAMTERDGVTVWLATTDDGAMLCLIVDDGLEDTTACSNVNRVAVDGLAVAHTTQGDGYSDRAFATLLLTAGREPAVHLDVHRTLNG